MKKTILLLFIVLQIFTLKVFAQFTKSQVEELTARGIAAAIEPDNSDVKIKAGELTLAYTEKEYIQNVCAVFDNLYRNWNYQRDPGGMEFFEKAGVSVFTYTGDCDDYAVLMISLVKSLGGEGRVVCVSGHAYPELYLGRDLTETEMNSFKESINTYYQNRDSRIRVQYLNYHTDIDGSVWLNLDYQDRYPGGRFVEYSPDAEHLVIYTDGSYELAYLNK